MPVYWTTKDLQVRESALTGESLPVEKTANDLPAGKHGIADASNSVFLGTAVQTGIGIGGHRLAPARDTALRRNRRTGWRRGRRRPSSAAAYATSG